MSLTNEEIKELSNLEAALLVVGDFRDVERSDRLDYLRAKAGYGKRTPDEILADFDAGCSVSGYRSSIDMRGVMWEIIDDVRNSYELAMTAELPNLLDAISEDPLGREHTANELVAIYIQTIMDTVGDYVGNNYGDD